MVNKDAESEEEREAATRWARELEEGLNDCCRTLRDEAISQLISAFKGCPIPIQEAAIKAAFLACCLEMLPDIEQGRKEFKTDPRAVFDRLMAEKETETQAEKQSDVVP